MTEPCTDSPLFDLPRWLSTLTWGIDSRGAGPGGHRRRRWREAGLAGEFVPDAVNVGAGVVSDEVAPWLELARKIGLLVGVLATRPPTTLTVRVSGELASKMLGTETFRRCRIFLHGDPIQRVTFVNAADAGAGENEVRAVSQSVRARTILQSHRRAGGWDRTVGYQRLGNLVRPTAGGRSSDQWPELRPACGGST